MPVKFLCNSGCGGELKPTKDHYEMKWNLLVVLKCEKCGEEKEVVLKYVRR